MATTTVKSNRYRLAQTWFDYHNIFDDAEGKVIVFCDTETSGLDPETDELLQFSAIKYVVTNGALREVETIDQYIMNERPIPEEVSKVNHITHESLVDMGAPSHEEAFETIRLFMADTDAFVAYNTPFDLGFVKEFYRKHGWLFAVEATFDVMAMFRDLVSVYKSTRCNLGNAAKHLGVAAGTENLHNALDDIRLTVKVFECMQEAYEQLPEPKDTSNLPIPRIYSHWFWDNPNKNTMKRIYFSTDVGKIFFERFDRSFGTDKTFSVDEVNMEAFIKAACRRLGVDSVEEMSHLNPPEENK